MDLRHLRHFLAVADALNYSRAADALHMAASPLSRSIQQLEHDLGGPLFDRGTRRVELTPLGAGLVPRARKLLDEVDDLTHSVRRQARGHQDILLGTRSVPATLIRVITADVIAEAAPSAHVRLQPMESVAQRGGRRGHGRQHHPRRPCHPHRHQRLVLFHAGEPGGTMAPGPGWSRRGHPAAASLHAARYHLPRLENGPGRPGRPGRDHRPGPRAIRHPAHVLTCRRLDDEARRFKGAGARRTGNERG